MCFLEHRVEPILGIAGSIVVERNNLRPEVLPRTVVDAGVFVDVVAEVNDQVGIFREHVRIAVEVAAFVVLA